MLPASFPTRRSADLGGVGPGQLALLGPSFRVFIGLLRPNAAAFIFVSFLGAIGVVLSVLAPRLLGDATNVLFEGVVSQMVPAGATQEQVVEGLRANGQTDLANIVSAMQNFVPGAGVDFERLGNLLAGVMALYVGSAFIMWFQGYVVNVVRVRNIYRLREALEDKVKRHIG